MTTFTLDPKLEKDTVLLGNLTLCQVRALPSEFNPWAVLVPRRDHIIEWHDLDWEDQIQLLREIEMVSKALEKRFQPTKLNIGALGNIVRQFHLHIIGRFVSDPSWPGPAWGSDRGANSELIRFKTEELRSELFG